MSEPYMPINGNRNEVIAVDPEQVKGTLNPVSFVLSTNPGTYSREEYTTSYIGSIFTAITDLEESWNGCKNTALKYVDDFENVPPTEDMPTDLDAFVDEEDSPPVATPGVLGAGVITTGVVNTTMLNIRKDPNAKSTILGTYQMDDNIEILEYDENSNWVKVKLTDDSTGYVAKKYVNVSDQNASVIKNADEPVANIESPQPSTETPVKESDYSSGQVKTKGGRLNIRDENHNIIGSLNNQSDVKIIGETTIDKETWYEIDLGNGKTGRVKGSYIDVGNNSIQNQTTISTPSDAPMKGTVVTSTNSLRVRKGPSINDEIVGYLPRNGDVDVLEYNPTDNWAKILYNGEEMYVYKKYVNLKGE